MTDRTTKDLVKADLIGLASTSLSAGALVITAVNYFIRNDPIAWVFMLAAALSAAASLFVGRRTLRRFG